MATVLYPQGYQSVSGNVVSGASITATSPLSVTTSNSQCVIGSALAGIQNTQVYTLETDFTSASGGNLSYLTYNSAGQFMKISYTPATTSCQIQLQFYISVYQNYPSSRANGPTIALYTQNSGGSPNSTPTYALGIRPYGGAGTNSIVCNSQMWIYNTSNSTLSSPVVFYLCAYGVSSPYATILSKSSQYVGATCATTVIVQSLVF